MVKVEDDYSTHTTPHYHPYEWNKLVFYGLTKNSRHYKYFIINNLINDQIEFKHIHEDLSLQSIQFFPSRSDEFDHINQWATGYYRGLRIWDGDKASIFHEKCDNHPMTLVLVETTKGIRFGGFTRKSWEGRCLKKTDNDAFVFSIDKNKIYDIVLNEPAVGAYPKFGPVFFGCQIRIYNECFTKGGSTCYRGLNYKTTKDFELNNGEQTYIVKDIEVYDIEAIDV